MTHHQGQGLWRGIVLLFLKVPKRSAIVPLSCLSDGLELHASGSVLNYLLSGISCILFRMAMRGWWWAVVTLLWAVTVVAVPLGVRFPYHTRNLPLDGLEDDPLEDRSRRAIEEDIKPKSRPGSPLHAVS